MWISKLQAGLAELNISCTNQQLKKLQTYLELLQKWNRTYNLSAITDPDEMVAYHILDSLVIFRAIPEQGYCLDVGTGAGLPGIPLSILLTGSNWTLLDSNGKKTRFVQQAIATCELSNVKVVHRRVQDYHAASPFDVVVSRAYASLQDYVSSVQHLWHTSTRLITMKTEPHISELQALSTQNYQLEITPLRVPGITEKRNLVLIQRKAL